MQTRSELGSKEVGTRATAWIDFPHHGKKAYRIWTSFDGRQWFQRHQWQREDGVLEMDEWIPGASGHVPKPDLGSDEPMADELSYPIPAAAQAMGA
jgi:hypothetical protein